MSRRTSAAIFGGLFLFFSATSLLWLRLHRAPPSWDDSWYLSNSLVLYDACVNRGIAGCAHRFLASLGFKAPLITALPLPFYCIFGRRWHAAFLVNTFAALLLFASIWAVAARLRGRRAAWMSVAIAGTLPLLYGLSRWFLVEYLLAACVAAAFWLGLAARRAPNLRLAAAFGAVSGLGLLLKADFPLFAAPTAISLFGVEPAPMGHRCRHRHPRSPSGRTVVRPALARHPGERPLGGLRLLRRNSRHRTRIRRIFPGSLISASSSSAVFPLTM